MPLESFMRRKMHASLSPSSPSSASPSSTSERRSSAHFSTAAKSKERLEASHSPQSTVEAAADAAARDEYRDEAEEESESQVSRDYEVVDYQRHREDTQEEAGATDDCNSHEVREERVCTLLKLLRFSQL
jgi:hypothetical protein